MLARRSCAQAKETWATNIADMDISDDEGAKKKPAGADKEADEGMEVDAKPAGNMFSMLTGDWQRKLMRKCITSLSPFLTSQARRLQMRTARTQRRYWQKTSICWEQRRESRRQ